MQIFCYRNLPNLALHSLESQRQTNDWDLLDYSFEDTLESLLEHICLAFVFSEQHLHQEESDLVLAAFSAPRFSTRLFALG